MSIRVDVSSVQSQSSSVQKMCNAYIEEMENVKQEIAAFIMEVHLKGKTYTSAKSYFSSVYLPLADGIILLCEQMISAHEQFPQQYIERVDSNSLESEILQDQIEQLEELIQLFESFSVSNIIIIDPFRESIEKCRETQQSIAGKLERLIAFDKSSATIFSDIQELLADVATGIDQVTNGKAWNETTETFHIKNWDLSWATRINEKKELAPNEVDHIQASSEEEQIKAFLNAGKEGTPFDPNDFADPYDEPITVADKMEVLGGNSPLSGTPDGLAGPAMFAFNVGKGAANFLVLDDFKTLSSKDETIFNKTLAVGSLIPVGKVLKAAKLSKFSDGIKASNKGSDTKKVIEVTNMNAFLTTKFGKTIKPSLAKTKQMYHGQSIYKVEKNTGKYLKKGDHIYLDALHKDHLEVASKQGKIKYVLNLDGTMNRKKTNTAIREGRKINK